MMHKKRKVSFILTDKNEDMDDIEEKPAKKW